MSTGWGFPVGRGFRASFRRACNNARAGRREADTAVIRIEIGRAVLHIAPDCNPDRVAALAAALKRVL